MLDGVSLLPPGDGRLWLSRAGGGDQAVLVVEAEAGVLARRARAEPVH
jgi:hypothetical protein